MEPKKHEEELLEIFRFTLYVQNFNKSAETKYGITFIQWFLLKKILENPAITLQELSKIIGVHPSTLTQNLKRLVKKDLVLISEDPKDGRKKIVSVLRRGKELSELSMPDRNDLIDKWKNLKNSL